MKYKVDIAETYKRTIEIEAADEDEAYEIVDEKVGGGEIDLPCDGGKYDYEREIFVEKAVIRMKKYYAVTTSMLFEKTVLVPVDEVENIEEAKDLVDEGVENSIVDLLNESAECETKMSCYADENGIVEYNEDDAKLYQILHNFK